MRNNNFAFVPIQYKLSKIKSQQSFFFRYILVTTLLLFLNLSDDEEKKIISPFPPDVAPREEKENN